MAGALFINSVIWSVLATALVYSLGMTILYFNVLFYWQQLAVVVALFATANITEIIFAIAS